MEKRCRLYGEVKALEDFPVRKTARDGRRTECKRCLVERTAGRDRSDYNRTWREVNRERLRAYDRKRRARPTEYFREYRAANREAVLANEARYRAANREKQTIRRQTRRALPLDDDARAYIRVLLRDPCSYCGGKGGSIDHIVPVDAGGTNDWWNLTSACLSCNSRKRTRTLLHFLLVA